MGLLNPGDKVKASIDFKNETYTLLTKVAERLDESKSTIVNYLLANVLGLSQTTKNELAIAIDNMIRRRENSDSTEEIFGATETQADIERLRNMVLLLNNGNSVENSTRQTIYLRNGMVDAPNDFIVADKEHAAEYEYCGVIEFRNAQKYDLPHIMYFTNFYREFQYTDEEKQRIYNECIKAYPRFKDILNLQVIPIYKDNNEHSTNPADFINMEEWEAAPTIGMFSVPEKGDMNFWRSKNPPYGIEITRNED